MHTSIQLDPTAEIHVTTDNDMIRIAIFPAECDDASMVIEMTAAQFAQLQS